MDLKLVKAKDIKDLKKQIKEIGETNNSIKEQWLNYKEAADYLGISVRTLVRIRTRGDIAYSKIGKRLRFKKSDIIAYINKCLGVLT